MKDDFARFGWRRWLASASLPLFSAAFFLALAAPLSPLSAQTTVAVTQIVEHPALDAVRDGIRDRLSKRGYAVGDDFVYLSESAQGSPSVSAQIARRYAGLGADVLVGISTPSAQSLAAVESDRPVVFSAVTDPLDARLVSDLDRPGGNVTGVSDLLPIPAHLDLVERLVPSTRRLGVIYNPGEANSASLLKLIRADARKRGWSVVEGIAPKTGDVLSAARSLAGKIDAFYIPTDNTVVSAFESVVKAAQESQTPLFAGDTASVKRGAAAALGFDYYDVGLQTGDIVADILQGADPGDIPVQFVKKLQLHVNPKAARETGLRMPRNIIDEAEVVIR